MSVADKVIPTVNDPELQGTGGPGGALIINADDWGRDQQNTDRICDCKLVGTVSSVSAMVFMEDSERAANIAREHSVDAGLHLNLTTPFTAGNVSADLNDHHERIIRYLRGNRLAQVVYHPGLTRSFEYVVARQLEEFQRLYGVGPERIDGHHHMHLSANVLLQKLLPSGTLVRRNFSFQRGEKSFSNRLYRRFVDILLARRHLLTDFLFSLSPLNEPGRLQRVFSLASQFAVEVETHPVNPDEFRFLEGGEIFRWIENICIASGFDVPERRVGSERK